MTIHLSDRTRKIVTETLPLMEQHRDSIEQAMERHLARCAPDGPSGGRTKAVTRAIADLLYGHARQLGDAPSGVAETAQHPPTLALGAEPYSSFGDALKPIMRDALGVKATPAVTAAWGDTYWAIVRTILRQETRLAA